MLVIEACTQRENQSNRTDLEIPSLIGVFGTKMDIDQSGLSILIQGHEWWYDLLITYTVRNKHYQVYMAGAVHKK